MRPTIKFTPNESVELGLQYPNGKIVQGFNGDQAMYSLSFPEGHVMFVDLALSQRIAAQQLQPGEHFFLCKRPKNGATPPRWDLWLSPATEQMRAQHEMASRQQESQLERDLDASIMQARARKAPQSAPAPQPPPATGTYGPRPVQQMRPNPAWADALLEQTNQLISVYAAACDHAAELGVPPAVVRAVMISSFIGIQRRPGGTNA